MKLNRIAIWTIEEAKKGQNTVFMLPYRAKELPELQYSIEINTIYNIYGNITYGKVWEIGERPGSCKYYTSEELCNLQNAGSFIMAKFKLSYTILWG